MMIRQRFNLNNQPLNLNGYKPYHANELYGGEWIPFNQVVSGHSSSCQGLALFYIENNCCMQSVLAKSDNSKAYLPAATRYQQRAGTIEQGRMELLNPSGKIKCSLVSIDMLPREFSLTTIIKRIEASQGNIFFLTGYLQDHSDGKILYEAAHAMVIANVGNRWKFFEGLRGEVTFPTLECLTEWLKVEARDGVLKEFTSEKPVEIKVNLYRRYTNYSLDIYVKDFSLNQKEKPTMQARL